IRERRTARISGIFIVTLALGMAVGAGYESVEWFEDKLGILGGNFVKGLWDTETDLLADTSGSLVGATFLTVWAMHGWSSRRVTVVPVPQPGSTRVVRRGRAGWPVRRPPSRASSPSSEGCCCSRCLLHRFALSGSSSGSCCWCSLSSRRSSSCEVPVARNAWLELPPSPRRPSPERSL